MGHSKGARAVRKTTPPGRKKLAPVLGANNSRTAASATKRIPYSYSVVFPADSGQKISPQSIAAHALSTFGSKEKAQHWMNRPNPLFQGKTPSQVMRTDAVAVEAELVRIDHGVYV
jgi:uncharacterized protein (DUF2384 family)